MGKGFREEKMLASKQMPPGKFSCNARRKSTDSYCQLPGVSHFARCPQHGGSNTKAIDVFKKAIPLEQAEKLETLLNDTMSMDNELASAKTMLVEELETYHRSTYYIEQFSSTLPARPMPDDPDFENTMILYNDSIDFHRYILEMAQSQKSKSFSNAMKLIRILSDGVAKNAKIKEGNKFQLDVKQISKLLKVQLEAHMVCRGCPKLLKVVTYIEEHTKDIPLDPKISRDNREAIGKRAYSFLMEEVKKRMPSE